mgnify:CR=1 FL=1
MEAYFDNSATTQVFDCVKDAVVNAMTMDYGNAAARHMKGVEAEKIIKEARREIANSLKVQEKEILFTSGGTESNNLALIGTALANQRTGKHLITSAVEHPSVYNTMAWLEEQGFEITYLPVDSFGCISLAELEEAVREDTILVSIMYVNNEIGAVEPVEEIARCIKNKNPKTYFHVDAIQAYGKFQIRPKKQGIDLLSVSAHKIHGPKGIGFLYIDEKVKIRPIVFGGGQQKGMRSGTENVPGIAGLARAAELVYADLDRDVDRMYGLREMLIDGVSRIEDVRVNGCPGREGAPHIVSLSVRGVRSEVLLHALEEREIYVSAGSACSSNKPQISDTLKAIGVERDLLGSTIRFSFSVFTTEEEIKYTIQALEEMVPMLRRYTRT